MALIELAMNRLISLHFVGKHDDKFIAEFLQNAYFSFELRKRVFRQIFKSRYPENHFPWKAMDDLQQIRNIVAHARIDEKILKLQSRRIKTIKPFYYTYQTVEEDADSLHKKFEQRMGSVAEALNSIGKDTNIRFTRAED